MLLRLLILFCCFQQMGAFAQTQRIDSMRSRLPLLEGRAKISCLNQLSNSFICSWIHSDSALRYAQLAYQQARAENDVRGAAQALIHQADVMGKLLGQPQQMLVRSRMAIELLQQEKDGYTLGLACNSLAIALAMTGKYQQALDTAFLAKEIALRIQNKKLQGWSAETIGFAHAKNGEYWKAFEHLVEAQQIGKELNDSLLVSLSLAFIARSFNRVGDPEKALRYYHEFLSYAGAFTLLWPHLEDMAYAHLQLKQYDSVLYYQQKHARNIESLTSDLAIRKKFSSMVLGFSADLQLERKQYDSVLSQILPAVSKHREHGDVIALMNALLISAKAFQGKGDYAASLRYGRVLYQLAGNKNNKQFLKDAAEQLSATFGHIHKTDSAFFYFRQFTSLKDSMETARYAGRTALYLAASQAETKIRLLQKDKALQEQQLNLNKKEVQRQVQAKNVLIGGFILAVVFSVIITRNLILKRKNEKLRNEQEQSALKRKALELEMQALRAQMNPHFIFNCLSAIDSLIQTNQSDRATTCLSRFAKLIRGVLDGSKNNLVPFEKDFETLKLYLEMEQFRCNDKFSYQLHAEDALLNGDYKVPPLIIQPFIENAIHHGLLNKQQGSRQVNVEVELSDNYIVYAITDNGIGRKKAAYLKQINKPDRQSYGIAITKERIQLHNRNDRDTNLEITDLEEGGVALGTKAVVRLHCLE